MTDNRLVVLSARIRASHEAASRSAQDAMEHAFECGRGLIEARASIKHAGWKVWVAEHLPFGLRQAERYIRLAKHESQIRDATSKSPLSPNARYTLEKVIASVEAPRADAFVGGRPASKKTSKRSPGSPGRQLEDLLRELEALELDPDEVAKSTSDPERLQAAVEPAYHQLRLLYNALNKRLKDDGKRPAAAPQQHPFEAQLTGMLR